MSILGFLLGEHASLIMDRIETIVENYPPQVLRILMNHIGTHDTERALTVLGGEPAGSRGREWQSAHTLSPEQRETGLERIRLAALLQFMLPGVPCIYYGDEAGDGGLPRPVQPAHATRGDTRMKTLSHGTATSACCGRSTATF